MTAPAPQTYAQGQGSVNGDGLNTFLQVVLNFAQLRNFTALSNMGVYVLGQTAAGDGGQGVFYYNSSSTATDNNSTVVVPTGAIQGAWLKEPTSTAVAANVRYIGGSATTDVMLTSDNTVVWNSSASAAKTETLQAPTNTGQIVTIKDGVGNAATYPITLAGYTVIGSSVINTPFGSLSIQADGVSKWLVI